jgi:hypothetical protein
MSRKQSSRLDEAVSQWESLWDFIEFGILPQQPTQRAVRLPAVMRLDACADTDCVELSTRLHCGDVQCLAHGGRADIKCGRHKTMPARRARDVFLFDFDW